jgi:hypothetical protein
MILKVENPKPAVELEYSFKEFKRILVDAGKPTGNSMFGHTRSLKESNPVLWESAMDALCELIRKAFDVPVGLYKVISNGYGEFKCVEFSDGKRINAKEVFPIIQPFYE